MKLILICFDWFSGETEDFDLVVLDTSTGHIYHDDNELIPKNTDLVVQRIPYNSFPYHRNQIIARQKTYLYNCLIFAIEELISLFLARTL